MNSNTISSSQSLDENILLELDKIQKGSFKRRLTNELVEFVKKGSYIHAEYEYTDTTPFITITIVLEDNVYHFEITDDYPFKPPKNFRINYKNYKKYLKINSSKTLNELKLYTGFSCLCCYSISCGDNWFPSLKLNNFIDEYKKNKKYRNNIIKRVLAQKIIDKYLYPYVNLFEWIF
jgi:hypothetical protein